MRLAGSKAKGKKTQEPARDHCERSRRVLVNYAGRDYLFRLGTKLYLFYPYLFFLFFSLLSACFALDLVSGRSLHPKKLAYLCTNSMCSMATSWKLHHKKYHPWRVAGHQVLILVLVALPSNLSRLIA